jgi:hypothetical protein
MTALITWRRFARLASATAAALLLASTAAAQGAIGSGPQTSSLADKEPVSGVFRVGPLRIAPGLTIREMGHDDNVFDEAVDPKEDWLIAGTPDISVFTRLRFVQLAGYAGSEMQYYHTYESENDIGYSFKGRADLLLSRISPFIGAAQTRSRTRPNGEIDVRADQLSNELSGGVAYELSAHAQVFAAAIQTKNDFEDAFQSGVSLEQSLSRQGLQYQGGFKTALTPLLSMQLSGGIQKDEFKFDPTRNGESRSISASFTIDTAAVISGGATFGFQDYKPVDPLVEPFRGLVGSGFITYPLLEIGHFNFGFNRGTQYSFDSAEAYYLENSFTIVYTQRLIGQVDLQGNTARSFFDYGNKVGSEARRDSLESYNGNLGYNLRNKTRVSANYEYARRRSPEIADRNYIRRRVYLAWMVAF